MPASPTLARPTTPRRRAPWIAATLCALLLAACGGGSDGDGGEPPPPPAPEPLTASAVIGPAGGTLTGPDGVQLVVPAGALQADTTLGITRHPTDAPQRDPLLPPGDTVYAFTPHGTAFALPVTIRFPVAPGNTDPQVLMTGGDQEWTQQPALVEAGFASVQRLGFSWGMMVAGCASSPDRPPTSDSCFAPSGGTLLTATPAQSLVRLSPPINSDAMSSAGSFRLDTAASLSFTGTYHTWPSCSVARVTLYRVREGVSPPAVQTLQALDVVLLQGHLGRRGAGNTTAFAPVAVTHQDAGRWTYAVRVECRRADGFMARNGDDLRLQVEVPAPTVFHGVGGSASGLSGSGLVLRNNGGDDLAVPADGGFRFATAIGAGTPYDVTVASAPAGQSCSVANGSGLATAEVTNVAVSCSSGPPPGPAWQPPVAPAAPGVPGDALDPHVALHADGSGFAAWVQGTQLLVSRYAPATGWAAPQDLKGPDGQPRLPRVAVDGNGRALVVWAQTDAGPSGRSIRASHFDGSAWDAPAVVQDAIAGTPETVRVAMDGAGNAIAVWDGPQRVMSSRFVAGGGWGWPAALDGNIGDARTPDLAVFGNGLALAVWMQHDGSGWRVMHNMFNGTGWSSADVLDGDSGAEHEQPRIAGDGSASAVAVWSRNDGSTRRIVARHYTMATGWSGSTGILSGPATDTPVVAMNAQGDYVVGWKDRSVPDVLQLWARTVPVALGWDRADPAQRIDAALPDATGERELCLALAPSGRAVAVWTHPDASGRRDLYGNLADAAGQWGTAGLVEHDDSSALGAWQCGLAVDGNDHALAVWNQPDASAAYRFWGASLR